VIAGNKAAVLFCWRQPGHNLNATVSANGMVGLRTLERAPYFVSGVGFPDWTIYTPDTFSKGNGGVFGGGLLRPTGPILA
jgi:hypothetical protein